MNQYGTKDYWEDRYKKDDEDFDWYQRYSSLKPFVESLLNDFENPRVLVLGCGTSRLSEDLYKEGYQ